VPLFIRLHSSKQQVTQLGHVKDLATAFTKCMGNKKAYNQVYNISGAPPARRGRPVLGWPGAMQGRGNRGPARRLCAVAHAP